ncbi:MAG: ATP synthase subunit I [candidate division FCPU426 bacterium]
MKRPAAIVWLSLIGLSPLACWAAREPRWALGLLVGEALGAMSYLWIGLSLRRGLAQDPKRLRRYWWWHSGIRFALLAVVLFLALKWPAVEIWAVVAGYTLVQLPAAVFRAMAVAG